MKFLVLIIGLLCLSFMGLSYEGKLIKEVVSISKSVELVSSVTLEPTFHKTDIINIGFIELEVKKTVRAEMKKLKLLANYDKFDNIKNKFSCLYLYLKS